MVTWISGWKKHYQNAMVPRLRRSDPPAQRRRLVTLRRALHHQTPEGRARRRDLECGSVAGNGESHRTTVHGRVKSSQSRMIPTQKFWLTDARTVRLHAHFREVLHAKERYSSAQNRAAQEDARTSTWAFIPNLGGREVCDHMTSNCLDQCQLSSGLYVPAAMQQKGTEPWRFFSRPTRRRRC
jgi:hypothetical protein